MLYMGRISELFVRIILVTKNNYENIQNILKLSKIYDPEFKHDPIGETSDNDFKYSSFPYHLATQNSHSIFYQIYFG